MGDIFWLKKADVEKLLPIWLVWFYKYITQPKISREQAQIRWRMHLISGYVNTNYLFSMTEDDADEEQQKLYRLKHFQQLQ